LEPSTRQENQGTRSKQIDPEGKTGTQSIEQTDRNRRRVRTENNQVQRARELETLSIRTNPLDNFPPKKTDSKEWVEKREELDENFGFGSPVYTSRVAS
jgi:hypothetical protein